MDALAWHWLKLGSIHVDILFISIIGTGVYRHPTNWRIIYQRIYISHAAQNVAVVQSAAPRVKGRVASNEVVVIVIAVIVMISGQRHLDLVSPGLVPGKIIRQRFALRIWPGTIQVSRSRWMPSFIQDHTPHVCFFHTHSAYSTLYCPLYILSGGQLQQCLLKTATNKEMGATWAAR